MKDFGGGEAALVLVEDVGGGLEGAGDGEDLCGVAAGVVGQHTAGLVPLLGVRVSPADGVAGVAAVACGGAAVAEHGEDAVVGAGGAVVLSHALGSLELGEVV